MSDGYTYTTIAARREQPTKITVSFYLDEDAWIVVPGAGTGSPHLTIEHGDVTVRVAPRSDAITHAGRGHRPAAGRPGRRVCGGDRAAGRAAAGRRRRANRGVISTGWGGRNWHSCRPRSLPSPGLARKRGDQRMRDHVPGEQYAQVDNADPFTAPVWRSPVHRTPEWVIWLVQLVRLLIRVIWFLIRHPLLDAAAGIVVTTWAKAGWPGVVVLANVTVAALVTLRLARPDWYARLVTVPAKSRWRWWCYRRRWQPVMTIAGLAPTYRGRVTVPVLGKVQAGPCADLVTVRLVSGQSPKLFADRAQRAGARVRGPVVPHPHRRTRDGGPGTGPPGRPGGGHPGPAHPG